MAQTTWTLKGKILLQSQFPELTAKYSKDGDPLPLAGVRVKVSAKELSWDPSGWQEWGEDVTNEDGYFEIKKEKDKSKRFFRVRVMFKDDDLLKLYPDNGSVLSKICDGISDLIPGGPVVKVVNELTEELLEAAISAISRAAYDVDWMTVLEDNGKDEKRSPSVVDFGDLTFKSGGGEERGGMVQRRHADIWFLTRKMMEILADFGPGLGFIEKKPIAIKYPHNSSLIGDGVEAAYANPFTDTVHLIQNSQNDDFDLQTVMHELMHLWTYQHSTGETGLAWQLIIHGSTHNGRQAKTWTAFHEAWAEFAKNELYRRMFGLGATIYGGDPAEKRPYTRSELKRAGINNLADVDNFETGWMSIFNLLVCNVVSKLDMNDSGDFAKPTIDSTLISQQAQVSFDDLLRVFQPHGTGDYRTEMPTDHMTLTDYFNRLSASIPDKFTSKLREAYLAILDPAETDQPKDLLAPTAEPIPGGIGKLTDPNAARPRII